MRELTVLSEDYEPQAITFQFHNGNIELLNGLGKFEMVEIHFRLEGKCLEGKYSNNLVAFDLHRMSQSRNEGLGDKEYLEGIGEALAGDFE